MSGIIDKNIDKDIDCDINGHIRGDITGDINGDINGVVTGNINGDINGNIWGGTVEGDINGIIRGNIDGAHIDGSVTGNILGSITGVIAGDVKGNILGDLKGTIAGDLTGSVLGDFGVKGEAGIIGGNLNGAVFGKMQNVIIGLNQKIVSVYLHINDKIFTEKVQIDPGVTEAGSFTITKDKKFPTLSSWGPIFKVSLELKIKSYNVPNLKNEYWAEVLRFTNTDNDCCNVGDRIPAIFTNNNDKKVYVIMDINNKGNEVVLEHSFEENKWYKIELTQRKNYNDEKVKLCVRLEECKIGGRV